MKLEDNVKCYLESNLNANRKELIKGLAYIFDYSNELALKIYKIWREEYRLNDYKTIESQFSKEEIETLRKLDKIYKEELKRINWWQVCKMVELVFEPERTDRGWTYRQATYNLNKLDAEKVIEKACKQAAIKINALVNSREAKERAKAKYLKRMRNSKRGKQEWIIC